MAKNVVQFSERVSVDKSKALQAALGQIERAFGKGSIMRLGQENSAVDIASVSTGSLGLDIALGIGGLPRGRIVEIYGPESSGKTTLALHVAAEAQKAGGTCAFIDAEHALDPGYAAKLACVAPGSSASPASPGADRPSRPRARHAARERQPNR